MFILQDGAIWGYKSPIVAAKEVAAILGSNKDARILDTCSGTGKTGEFVSYIHTAQQNTHFGQKKCQPFSEANVPSNQHQKHLVYDI